MILIANFFWQGLNKSLLQRIIDFYIIDFQCIIFDLMFQIVIKIKTTSFLIYLFDF